MSLLLLVLLVVLAVLGHGYLWTDVVNWLHGWAGPRKLIDWITMGCLVAFLVLPLVVLLQADQVAELIESSSVSLSSFTKAYFSFCTLWGFYSLIVNSWRRWRANDRTVLADWQQSATGLPLGEHRHLLRAGLPRKLGLFPGNQVFDLTIDRKRLRVPHLPQDLQGLRIAHISDLHMTGRVGQPWFEHVVEQVNELAADTIMITGDIVEHTDCLSWLAPTLGRLRAELGVYFVLGNHDLYIDAEHTRHLLTQHGLVALGKREQHALWHGSQVVLAGNERPWFPEAAQLSPRSAEGQFRLALLHTPDQFGWAAKHEFHLALAGHTHGGQLRFPVLGPIACPSRYGIRYACGVFRRGNTVLHVTRGIGGKTPLRWNCPPEIAVLQLVCG